MKIVEFICNQIDDKNPRDDYRYTPLHEAARNGHLEIVKYLVQVAKDKNPKNTKNISAALENARQERHTDVIQFLENL